MAWGCASKNGIDDIVDRLRRNDAGLTSLYLMRTRRFDEGGARALGEALAENTMLSELHLTSHPINIAHARFLASGLMGNRSIRHVSIGNSTLGDEALTVLCDGFRKSSSLRTLDLEKKGLTGASCESLREAVLESTTIRHVMLSDNDIGDKGVADFLPCASRLEELELSSCLRRAEQWKLVARAMTEAFTEAKSLRRLDLDRNALDEQGAASIAESLSQLSALESLSLNGNSGLGPGGVCALAFPPSLRRLDIGSSGAGDVGVNALAELCEAGKLPNLEYVNVCGCGATSSGLAALLDGLQAGMTDGVVEVDAGGNVLGADGATTLMDDLLASVLRCQRLQSLRLHGCALGAEGARAFARAFSADNNATKTSAHALQDVDISGNNIPEADMLAVLGTLPQAVAADGPFSRIKTLIIAANPNVEGSAVAERVEDLANLGVVILRAANDGVER